MEEEEEKIKKKFDNEGYELGVLLLLKGGVCISESDFLL
jgi:hypothetical protein